MGSQSVKIIAFTLLGLVAFVYGGTVEFVPDPKPSFTDELKDVKYVVAVDPAGVTTPLAESNATHRLVQMRDARGKRYSCSLPVEGASHQLAGARPTGVAQDKTPSELLDGLATLCFYRIDGWWTYQLCHGRHVRQFHQEGEEISQEYMLGRFDASRPPPDEVLRDSSAVTPWRATYVGQVYGGGQACDITGEPRETEVRYVCSPDGKDSIVGMEETATCRYRLTMATTRLCRHAGFRQKEAPVAHILCTALDPDGTLKAGAQTLADGATALPSRSGDDDPPAAGDAAPNPGSDPSEEEGHTVVDIDALIEGKDGNEVEAAVGRPVETQVAGAGSLFGFPDLGAEVVGGDEVPRKRTFVLGGEEDDEKGGEETELEAVFEDRAGHDEL